MDSKLFSFIDSKSNPVIKEYTIEDDSKKKNFFHIESLNTATSINIEISDYAHSHDFYTIFCVLDGEGIMSFDFNDYRIEPKTILFIPSGLVHQIRKLKITNGFIIYFSEDFLNNTSAHVRNLIKHRIFSFLNALSISYIKDDGTSRLLDDYNMLFHRYTHPKKSDIQKDYLASLLSIFLFDTFDCCEWKNTKSIYEDSIAYHVCLEFMELIEHNFKSLHSAKDYKEKLSVSPNTLAKYTTQITGKTPTELIHDRIAKEAKRMLFEQDGVRIKEIAYNLGFTDNSNFIKFFKRYVGMSPVEFRENL